jgi:hypothetical protein
VNSIQEFRAAPLRIDLRSLVSTEERERLAALPDRITLRDKEIEIRYDVEEDSTGNRTAVARLRLPEKIARTLTEAELPQLDRPLRFVVLRGQRGAVRADSLAELQEALEQPWSQEEIDSRDDDSEVRSDERAVRRLARRGRPPRRSRRR